MSKETELSDEQIDNCVGNLGMAENSILVGPEEIRKAMRAVIAADRELCRGDARMPPLPEPWQGFQFNPGWDTWENVVRGAINEPRVMKAFTAEQMHEYAQAALAAKDVELEALTKQASAYKTLTESLEHRNATLQAGRAQWQEAVTTLASERQANALLTAEIATLTAERDVLKKDAERYRKDALRAATVAFGLVASSHPKELPQDAGDLAGWLDANVLADFSDDEKPEELFIYIIRAAIAKEAAK